MRRAGLASEYGGDEWRRSGGGGGSETERESAVGK